MPPFFQRVVAYIEEWCSLCKVILHVLFANLFSFVVYREHIACVGACLECTFLKELLHMSRETPVEM